MDDDTPQVRAAPPVLTDDTTGKSNLYDSMNTSQAFSALRGSQSNRALTLRSATPTLSKQGHDGGR